MERHRHRKGNIDGDRMRESAGNVDILRKDRSAVSDPTSNILKTLLGDPGSHLNPDPNFMGGLLAPAQQNPVESTFPQLAMRY
jgi:hypothetical protein